MQKNVVLNLSESKRFSFKKPKETIYDSVISVISDERKGAIKKVKKLYGENNIILSKNCDCKECFQNTKLPFKNFEREVTIPLVSRISRQIIEKYKFSLPIEKIVISATPGFACKIVEEIKNFARMFLIVSSEPQNTQLYDSLYFQHSTMISHISSFPKEDSEDCLYICYDEMPGTISENSAVLNFTPTEKFGERIVNASKISVEDCRMRHAKNFWAGTPGLAFCNLFGIEIGHNTSVDINNVADEIFLLDINAF